MTMTIGQVSKLTGVGVETIRFYERHGLINEPQRKSSGYRIYSEEIINRLRFIRRAKDLGFSLSEIESLLRLRVDSEVSCVQARQQALEKIAEIEGKIQDLQRVRTALAELISACDEPRESSQCPILEALARQEMF
ncbi:MAG TPA: heavy metal-responsive transcriptional regulator [Thermoanaerobaculia bacterium]|nr:heavy metal-responsive transcriptional regulator [Thermoanaerobaculia bacterium]